VYRMYSSGHSTEPWG